MSTNWFNINVEIFALSASHYIKSEAALVPGEFGVLGEVTEDTERLELTLLKLVVLVALSARVSSQIAFRCCMGATILSTMSPITWKLGSTMKSMKPRATIYLSRYHATTHHLNSVRTPRAAIEKHKNVI